MKAAAIADLAAGEQPAIVAQRYGIDPAKIRVWKSRNVTGAVAQHVTQQITRNEVITQPKLIERQIAFADLVLENLRAKLIATQRIAEYAATPGWLEKQTAADVAQLFRCLDSSAINILDRLAGRAIDQAAEAIEADE